MRLLEAFAAVGRPRIEWGGETLAADVVRRRVAGAAAWLLAQGLAPGDRVALHLPHGPEAPVLMLACWRAGLVAVPLDLHHPPARLAGLMERSGAKLLVTSGRRGAALARRLGGSALVLGDEWPLPGEGGGSAVERSPEDPALILWTSGSTGEPKGVTVPRRAVDAFVMYWGERLAVGPDDRLAWTAALSFDLSLFDIGVAMTRGATLVPVPERQLAFPRALGAWLEERGVTCIYSVPSLLDRALVQVPPSLRVVLSAGEALPAPLARRLRTALPDDGILGNLFGPTETNVSVAWLAPPGWVGEIVPIGAPCPYLDVQIVNDELLAAGGTVMSGYWGEPGRARWTERAGARWLHTGDRVRWEGEQLLFLGRLDRMVKIRGYRVEPEEVERVLGALPGVTEAAVLVRGSGDDRRLEAVVVGDADPDSLLDDLTRRLPSWACPARVHRVEALPRTPRGKVDYARIEA